MNYDWGDLRSAVATQNQAAIQEALRYTKVPPEQAFQYVTDVLPFIRADKWERTRWHSSFLLAILDDLDEDSTLRGYVTIGRRKFIVYESADAYKGLQRALYPERREVFSTVWEALKAQVNMNSTIINVERDLRSVLDVIWPQFLEDEIDEPTLKHILSGFLEVNTKRLDQAIGLDYPKDKTHYLRHKALLKSLKGIMTCEMSLAIPHLQEAYHYPVNADPDEIYTIESLVKGRMSLNVADRLQSYVG